MKQNTMKFTLTHLALGGSLVSQTFGHYLVNRLVIDGKESQKWQYNLESTKGLMPTKGDDIKTDTFRCGPGAFDKSATAQVAKVAAGSNIAFKLGDSVPLITHPGPVLIYLSKAPSDVKTYKGDGDWFKVHEDSICGDPSDGITDEDWCSWKQSVSNFTIPAATPPGQYLARWEHIGLHGAHVLKGAEFFFGCAMIEVTGSGTGTPGPLFKIPNDEVYSFEDPGIHFNKWGKPTSYPFPGPAVWDGSSSGSPTSTPVEPTAKPTSSTAPETPAEPKPSASDAAPTPIPGIPGAAPTPVSDEDAEACPASRRRRRRDQNRDAVRARQN